MPASNLYRLTAFASSPDGGNPAGVWIGDIFPGTAQMQRIAAEVGYSETAFITPASGRSRVVRYFSPEAEVSFCGHATIASGVALGQRDGAATYRFSTPAGDVPVTVEEHAGRWQASLVSVDTRQKPATAPLVARALTALGWARSELDPRLPPVRAYAGAWHLVLAVRTKERLARLDYDFEMLKALMLEHELTTLQLVWKENAHTYHARNPFPVGGVIEDPATGAAAAALGGYLRDAGFVSPPHTICIHQGDFMGRPGRLTLDIPAQGGIIVTGTATDIP